MTEETLVRKAVLYTDGGCHQKQKIGGFGIHGYVYQETPPKKGAGVNGYVLTEKGYKQKTPDDDPKGPVFIEHYIDKVGLQPTDATNNTAELKAFIRALGMALDGTLDVVGLHVVSDSEYVLKGAKRLNMMKKNSWCKASGEPFANVALWQELDGIVQALQENNIALSYDWVKGHNGEPGNVRADMLATVGLNLAGENRSEPEAWVKSADGYWKNTAEFSRLFGAHHIAFPGGNGTAAKETADGTKWLYRLYNDAGKQGSLKTIGTALVSASYGILMLNDEHEELEKVYQQQKLALHEDTNSWNVCLVRPQDIYRPSTVSMIRQFGDAAMYPTRDKELFSAMGQRLTVHFNPTLQALNAVDIFDRLEGVFNSAFDEDSLYTTTEITDDLFEITVKPAKGKKPEETVYKLRSFPENDDQYFDVLGEGKVNGKMVKRKIRLIYGIDLPVRNALTNAAKHEPKAWVATLVEPDGVWRYFVFIKTNEGMGVWHNPYASMLLPPPPT